MWWNSLASRGTIETRVPGILWRNGPASYSSDILYKCHSEPWTGLSYKGQVSNASSKGLVDGHHRHLTLLNATASQALSAACLLLCRLELQVSQVCCPSAYFGSNLICHTGWESSAIHQVMQRSYKVMALCMADRKGRTASHFSCSPPWYLHLSITSSFCMA